MNPLALIMLVAQIANMASQGSKAAKADEYTKKSEAAAKEDTRKREALALRDAMARTLGVDVMPYEQRGVDQPDKPSTLWEDVTSGVGQAVSNAAASNWADKMYQNSQNQTNANAAKKLNQQSVYPYESL
jgi:hypothetical protein